MLFLSFDASHEDEAEAQEEQENKFTSRRDSLLMNESP
jgi:hypothetical protein